MAVNYYAVNEAQNIALGQSGSILVTGTTACTNLRGVFVAIQVIEDCVFNSSAGGLSAETGQLFLSDTGTGLLIDADAGEDIDDVTFPAGITIYGRWTGFTLASGKVIAYVG